MRYASRKPHLERALLVVLVVGAWAAVLPRAVPDPAGDHGTFVSVAERLLAGDRLYSGVWDNKDPLFYYLLAGARALSDRGDVALEIAWLVAGSAAVGMIARLGGLTGGPRLIVAWVLAPLVLTGHSYEAGMTHLPGVVTALWITVSVLNRRWAVAGVLVVVLALLKLVLVPLGLGVLAVGLLHCTHRRPAAVRAGTAAVATALVAALVLASRGELSPYVEALRANVSYAGSAANESRWGPFVAHLRIVFTGGGLTTLAATAVVLLLSPARDQSTRRVLPGLVVVTTVAALVVLALTGLWPHHVQVLAVPALLAMITLAVDRELVSRLGAARHTALVCVAAYLLAGAPSPTTYLEAIHLARGREAAVVGVSAEARALAGRPPGGYARLGSNDKDAHARGLGLRRLVCPRFHAYVTDDPSTYDQTLSCLPRATYVLVDDSFRSVTGKTAWNDFVSRGRELLAEGFECESASFGELCSRR